MGIVRPLAMDLTLLTTSYSTDANFLGLRQICDRRRLIRHSKFRHARRTVYACVHYLFGLYSPDPFAVAHQMLFFDYMMPFS